MTFQTPDSRVVHDVNQLHILDAEALRRFQELQAQAVDTVCAALAENCAGTPGLAAPDTADSLREELALHVEFLRPALEFGISQPMIDYLRWQASVQAARNVPADRLPRLLDCLADFYAARLPGAEGVKVAAALREAQAGLLQDSGSPSTIYDWMPEPWKQSEAFEAALLAGNRRQAAALLQDCLAQGHSLLDVELHVIQPALYGVGLKWQTNKVSVAQEHLATAIAQALMTQALEDVEVPPSNGRTVLLACVEGNTHALGLQMVADGFQLAGWGVQYLGANVPTADLLAHIDQLRPDLLGLSVSFAHQLSMVRTIIARLSASLGFDRPAIIVGGLAINQFSRLADVLGADAWSPDAGAAVASAAALKLRRVGRQG